MPGFIGYVTFYSRLVSQKGRSDTSLFIYNKDDVHTFLLIYVIDIVITSSSSINISTVINRLANEFSIKDLGDLTYFLGIHVSRTEQGIFLSWEQYAANLLIDEKLANLNPASTTMEPKMDFTGTKNDLLDQETTTRYRRVLGSLQYLTTTHPDISYTVSKLSQFFAHPSKHH